jgi:pimeloyl-ACP methyl ester carboxylesterase
MLFNRATLGSPDDCPSSGNQELINGLIANPLNPNYILVMSDFIGYGSSSQYPSFYHSGDVNARNSLDGLLAARQILEDQQLPQGKYLFNLGFSQGGSEALYVAKLRDLEYKDKGVTFTKTFAGGGPTDYAVAYREYVKKDWCEDCKDVVMMLISCVENCHLDIDYKDLFKEPLASGAKEYVKTKMKSTLSDYGVNVEDSLHNLLQPAYMDVTSEEAMAFMAALEKVNLMNGWEPDLTQKYFIEHSRHDNYVPVQCVRAIIPWMKEKGFTQSIVPGKTNLQTNMMVFKLNHSLSSIV